LTQLNSQAIPSALMANTRSAIKTVRRIARQTEVNRSRKSRYKNAI